MAAGWSCRNRSSAWLAAFETTREQVARQHRRATPIHSAGHRRLAISCCAKSSSAGRQLHFDALVAATIRISERWQPRQPYAHVDSSESCGSFPRRHQRADRGDGIRDGDGARATRASVFEGSRQRLQLIPGRQVHRRPAVKLGKKPGDDARKLVDETLYTAAEAVRVLTVLSLP